MSTSKIMRMRIRFPGTPTTTLAVQFSDYVGTPDMADNNYVIAIEFSWDAGMVWITNKDTTGFTINVGNATGSETDVECLVYYDANEEGCTVDCICDCDPECPCDPGP